MRSSSPWMNSARSASSAMLATGDDLTASSRTSFTSCATSAFLASTSAAHRREGRRREIAVRLAVGASRQRRSLTEESSHFIQRWRGRRIPRCGNQQLCEAFACRWRYLLFDLRTALRLSDVQKLILKQGMFLCRGWFRYADWPSL